MIDRAEQALETGDPARARELVALAIAAGIRSSRAFTVLARAEAALGHIGAAIAASTQAVQIEATQNALSYHAQFLSQAHQHDQALETTRKALLLSNVAADSLNRLGSVCSRAGRHDAAAALFGEAVKRDPGDMSAKLNLASALTNIGSFVEAGNSYDQVLAADPGNGAAHLGLADLGSSRDISHQLATIERSLEQKPKAWSAVQLGFAAARLYEREQNFGRAAERLSRANAIARGLYTYSAAADERVSQCLASRFREANYFVGVSDAESSPIFVVGMPRTGTTLVERILSSHPLVGSAGELQAMPIALKRCAGVKSAGVLDIAMVDALAQIPPVQVAEQYHAFASAFSGDKPYYIDKLPANLRNIGYIVRAFPKSRVIVVQRGAMDSIASNYRTLFARNSVYHRYAYDPMEIARYYLDCKALAAFWQELFPAQVAMVRYEEVVSDPESSSQQLFRFLNIPWSPEVLNFPENRAGVATASSVNVRRPVFNDSVGRWRSYESLLTPAITLLKSRDILAE